MEFKRLPSLTKNKFKQMAFLQEGAFQMCIVKWNERQISLCNVFLAYFFPFLQINVCHLLLLSGTQFDFKAFIMFEGELRSISCIFSTMVNHSLRWMFYKARQEENSWKMNMINYTTLSYSSLPDFSSVPSLWLWSSWSIFPPSVSHWSVEPN